MGSSTLLVVLNSKFTAIFEFMPISLIILFLKI